jgi:hypothetical protein
MSVFAVLIGIYVHSTGEGLLLAISFSASVIAVSILWVVIVCALARRNILDKLPRVVNVTLASVRVVSPAAEEQFNWSECRWHLGTTWKDDYRAFLRRRRAIVLETPASRVACVPSEEDKDQWGQLLSQLEQYRAKQLPTLSTLLLGLALAALSTITSFAVNAILVALQSPLIVAYGWVLIAGILAVFPLSACLAARVDPYVALHSLGPASLEAPCAGIAAMLCLPMRGGVLAPLLYACAYVVFGTIVRRALRRLIIKYR